MLALDSSRALLMLLGLVIHATAPYNPVDYWVVVNPERSGFLALCHEWIHTFRMPGFFVLAGMLGAWALTKRGARDFLSRRLLRLALPLTVAALTLNPLQQLLLRSYAADYCGTDRLTCAARPAADTWIGHLWFLLYLLLFTILLVACMPLLKAAGRAMESRFVSAPRGPRLAACVVAPFAAYACWRLAVGFLSWAIPGIEGPWLSRAISFNHAANLLFFFTAGALLGSSETARQTLLSARIRPVGLGAAGLIATAVWWATFNYVYTPTQTLAEKVTFAVLGGLPTVLLTLFALAACLWIHELTRGRLAGLADWAYSVYLFHHLAAVAAALTLASVTLPVGLKFLVVLSFTAFASVAAAALIRKSKWLRLLFNGSS